MMKLLLCDTAGQEDYDALRPLSYPQTDVFIMTYSIISPQSLQHIKNKWHKEISDPQFGNAPIILVGTKSDMRDDPDIVESMLEENMRPVTEREGREMADELGAHAFIECSATTQEGLSDVFDEAAKCVMKARNIRKKSRWERWSKMFKFW
jgi:small GTP-binding protein